MELLRTMLFVPGNRAKMIEKAKGLSPDALIFDLEDAVPPAEKQTARRMVREAIDSGDFSRFRVFVRVNPASSGLLVEDLNAVVCDGLFGIVLPKVETGQELEYTGALLDGLESMTGRRDRPVKILPIIETVRGVLNVPEIAGAGGRLVGLSFGAEDFATDLGVPRSREGTEGHYPRVQIALHSRLADVVPIDTVYSDVNDDEGLIADTRLIRQLGFKGRFVIHPRQIEVVNEIFTPSEAEIEQARRVVDAYEQAEARGEASVAVDGKMVDIPIVERARDLLRLAGIIRESGAQG